jgi:osmotically-inducible protein OsmY
MPDRDNFDRERERRWDRSDRWPERETGDRARGGFWERDRDRDRERNEFQSGGRDRDREEWRGNAFSYTGNDYQTYQRGGSGSEGGYSREQSYGGEHELSGRGGGTGIRETERWDRGRDRGGDRERDWGRGASAFGGFGATTGYGGGMSTYSERGRFAGKGPKNWKRSDDRIRDDINERLTDHADIDATDIEVQVREGEVTLTGTVDNRHAKRLAEEIAENVSGVKDVHNNVRVQQSGYPSSTATTQPGSQQQQPQQSTSPYGSPQDRSQQPFGGQQSQQRSPQQQQQHGGQQQQQQPYTGQGQFQGAGPNRTNR